MMNKAVFLDRDGVVNVERGDYTWQIEDFELTVGLIDFLKVVQQKGYLIIIISNQACIGKRICTVEDVEKVHNYLKERLAREDLKITDIYYCPHHPNSGKCLCRKPESLLLEKAIARYEIDVNNSLFIGDRERDVEAGEKAGIRTILVNSNDHLCNYLAKMNL
jgi:D-glycero-D-manno-heptose 1,7-bisphosphate phosphatase